MARVNSGELVFDYDSDLRELMRQTLSLTNTSSYITDKKLDEIFDTNGKNRISYNPYADEVDINDIINDKPAFKSTLLANLESTYIFKDLMKSISYFPDARVKKSLVIYFMSLGFHIEFNDLFRLTEDIKRDDLDEQSLATIIEDNKNINQIIDSYMKDSTARTDTELNNLISTLRDNMKPEISEFASKLGTYIYLGKSSHVLQRFSETIELTPEEFKQLSEYINGSRANMQSYFKPEQNKLIEVFGLSLSTYKRRKSDGLQIIISNYGVNLAKEVIK